MTEQLVLYFDRIEFEVGVIDDVIRPALKKDVTIRVHDRDIVQIEPAVAKGLGIGFRIIEVFRR
jgi:hypothetical protein